MIYQQFHKFINLMLWKNLLSQIKEHILNFFLTLTKKKISLTNKIKFDRIYYKGFMNKINYESIFLILTSNFLFPLASFIHSSKYHTHSIWFPFLFSFRNEGKQIQYKDKNRTIPEMLIEAIKPKRVARRIFIKC